MSKGAISNQLTVWCAHCQVWDYLHSKKLQGAHKEAKQLGWTYTRKDGWVCPKCSNNACSNYGQQWHDAGTCTVCAFMRKEGTPCKK